MNSCKEPRLAFDQFVDTIARLRSKDGCPWDKEQTHDSIARNMIEEAYEAVDAIERGDVLDMREELGDVLLQVVLQSRIAEEAGEFAIADVIADVNDKMIRRHPHIFGDEAAFAAAKLSVEQIEQVRSALTAEKVLDLWDQIKILEKQQKAQRKAAAFGAGVPANISPRLTFDKAAGFGARASLDSSANLRPQAVSEGLLDGVPKTLPALMQAQDISRKAVAAGFEWPDLAAVWDQVYSEIEEYKAESLGSKHAEEEFGDLLFSLVNVARKEGLDAESALRASCRKFRARWAIMEGCAKSSQKHISHYSTEELEALWQQAKLDSKLSVELSAG